MGDYSPSLGEIMGVQNGLRGWRDVCGLGPNYFLSAAVERNLLDYIAAGKPVSTRSKHRLAAGRAAIVNFYGLLDFGQPFNPKTAEAFMPEVEQFLVQLKEQMDIWSDDGVFRDLDMSVSEQRIYHRIAAKCAPVIFNMGFADGVPHSSQVSRLTAGIMSTELAGRPSQILQGAIVGYLHDPKFHPTLDLDRQNLATHPVIASALAYTVLHDETISAELLKYFHGNATKVELFISGIVDALGVNNDSRFVQMMVILPLFIKHTSEMFGTSVADGFKAVMEARIECGATDNAPPKLPDRLLGCLSQISLDTGIRGISRQGWIQIVRKAAIKQNPLTLFHQLLLGKQVLAGDQLERLRTVLAATPSPILRARIHATTLLHHHQEVTNSGRKVAEALVIADPMMLSPHKVAAVYKTAIFERIGSYIRSFDDNIRLLPKAARSTAARWQRAVYLSMLDAADRLNGTTMLQSFKNSHKTSSVAASIADLRSFLLKAETWGTYGEASGTIDNDQVRQALVALESAYVAVVNQYRQATHQGNHDLDKFYPVPVACPILQKGK
jgi:hypothetical protein